MTTTQDSGPGISANQTNTRSPLPMEATPYPYACGLHLLRGELPVLLLFIMTVNFLSLAVLWRMRRTSDSVEHLLVSVLNLNDFLTAAVHFLSWVVGWSTCGQALLIDAVCGLLGWLGGTMVAWSAFIILVMTTLRFLSLVKPFYYRRYVNARKVVKTLAGTLVFSLAMYAFPFTGLPKPYFLYEDNLVCSVAWTPGRNSVWQRAFMGFIGALCTTSVCYVMVCNTVIIIKLSRRNLVHTSHVPAAAAAGNNAAPNNTAATTTNTTTTSGAQQQQQQQQQQQPLTRGEIRLAKTRAFQKVILMVSFVYAICYAPYGVLTLIDVANDAEDGKDVVHSIVLILLFFSPLLNPFIYGLFNKNFRGTLINMIRCRGGGGAT